MQDRFIFLPLRIEQGLHKVPMQHIRKQTLMQDMHTSLCPAPGWSPMLPYIMTLWVRVHMLQYIACPLWPYFTITCWSLKSIAIKSWNRNLPSLLCCWYHRPKGSQPLWGLEPRARCTGWTFTLWAAALLQRWMWDYILFFNKIALKHHR